jgi:endonuclease YncB( thermonuclease family)
MGLAFFILQALAILFAVVYFLQRLFSPRRGAGSRAPGLFALAFFLELVVAVAFPNDVRYFTIEHFKSKVVSVDGPNAFTVKVGRKVPLALYDTVPPAGAAEAQKAEQFLRDRLLGKKVTVDFPTGDKSRPRSAVVILDKTNLNEIMISEGLLRRAAVPAAAAETVPGAVTAPAPATAATPAATVPGVPPAAHAPETAKRGAPFSRFFIWMIGGCIGAALFGQALLGRKVGLDFFLAFVLLAVRDMALAAKADTSLAPPIIALAIALVAGPSMKSADLWAPFRRV